MRSAITIVILCLAATPARAEWGDGVDVYKVFLGAYPEPNAYYIMLDVSEGDNFLLGSKLFIYGPGSGGTDDPPEVLELYDHVATGHFALIANEAAESLFNVEADLQLELPLRRDGGKICFDGRGVVDCVAWGDYAGPTEGVGTAFNAPEPPELSSSILRKLPGPVDDSNEDFVVGDPWPTNIWGETGFTSLINCGDGHTDPGEECDDAGDNSDSTPNACRSDCALPACGDRVIDFDEECDEGASNSDSAPDACRADCTLPSCGDAVTDSGEQCDDGNGSSSDACLDTCMPATCGDGFVHAGVETCDDGNTSAGDGCAGDCTQETTPGLVSHGRGGCRATGSAGGAWGAGAAWGMGLAIIAVRRRNKRRVSKSSTAHVTI
jgi:cysteine-rich repeat protein